MDDRDPLAALIVDEGSLARQELADALSEYVRLTERGDLLLERAFDDLATIQRVACVLLAFRAAALLGLRERPGGPPREIVEASGMPAGTVRPKLGALVRQRIAARDGEDYVIPAHGLRRAVDLIQGEGHE